MSSTTSVKDNSSDKDKDKTTTTTSQSDTRPDYTFEQKERLARRIQKLRKPDYYLEIENIIGKHNPELEKTTTPSGRFMYFQNLTKDTYYALEKYVKKILKLKTLSETSESIYSPETTKYSDEDDLFSSNPKLRYSNKERNIIKRKIYDNQINKVVDSDEDRDHNRDHDHDHDRDRDRDHHDKVADIDKIKSKKSENNVFVKRKGANK